MTENKINNKLTELLLSKNTALVHQALNEIVEKGNSHYIPMLIDILHSHDDEEIKKKITKILSEVKRTDAAPLLVKAIENDRYSNIKEILVRTCWENGLDFTNYFSAFIDILIHDKYMVAFEAFTVIENNQGHISEASALEYTNRLKESLPNVDEDRQALIHHIIQFMPSLIRP